MFDLSKLNQKKQESKPIPPPKPITYPDPQPTTHEEKPKRTENKKEIEDLKKEIESLKSMLMDEIEKVKKDRPSMKAFMILAECHDILIEASENVHFVRNKKRKAKIKGLIKSINEFMD